MSLFVKFHECRKEWKSECTLFHNTALIISVKYLLTDSQICFKINIFENVLWFLQYLNWKE